ncbi:G2 and S phase-expressed protein 1 [Salarias fasciatus]|uniref:G2 and S phase-expressed protein 1 n=1 Tax=Salarias fasciatus TaxID=181472 RepID=UPI00117700EF|nr:G2 and S phase-expressed protein 1-like [Salarias fasciatus]
MDGGASSDVFFLPEEKFDFDVSLSPCSTADEDEDEVFVGPVSHKERCVSQAVASRLQSEGVQASWSPLTGEQLDAICQEAHKLANELQSSEPAGGTAADTEDFIQDGEAKLGVLDPAARVLSPVKRETFCVQDSPMKLLPPAVQRQVLRGSGSRAARASCSAASTSLLSASASSSRPSTSSSRLSTSSPRDGAKAPARPALRGKAAMGGSAVLPNKLPAMHSSGSASRGRMERTRLQPPSKVACGSKRSPTSRRSTRSQSCEDLLSDTESVTSNLSDSSVGSCTSGKRVMAPPTKTVGVRSTSGGKAPPLQNRRNTSSSSSSVSSFNSSTSLSPAQGKVGSSLNCSLSGGPGPAPGSVPRAANPGQARRSTVEPPRPATAGRRSLSTHPRLPEAECVKAARRSLLKRADSTPAQATPSKRPAERQSGRPQGPLRATALPTPGTAGRAAAGVSSVPKPKRLMSLSSLDSLPQKPSAGPLTPSAGGCASLQVKARRPSALPTPVRRRVSAIPSPRSTNPAHAAPLPPPPVSASDRGSARRECSFSPTAKPVQEEEPGDIPDIQPFCLDEEEEEKVEEKEEVEEEKEEEDRVEPPSPPSPPPHRPKQTESPDGTELSREEPEPNGNVMEVQTPGDSNGQMEEVLLLDVPAPDLQPQEKLLIDLTNTPDLIKTGGKTASAAQLIDLSSPLIKWSPEEKGENTAPLINLSF